VLFADAGSDRASCTNARSTPSGGLDRGFDASVHWRLVHPAVLRERDDISGGDGTDGGPRSGLGEDRQGRRVHHRHLVGFTAALRRSELAALPVDDVAAHPRARHLNPRSKSNQTGDSTQLVVLPGATSSTGRPAAALEDWLELAEITPPRQTASLIDARSAIPVAPGVDVGASSSMNGAAAASAVAS
jgi:hypothetical protein